MDWVKLIVGGAKYRKEIRKLEAEMREALETGSLSIADIFEIVPLRIVTPGMAEKLIGRGEFSVLGNRFVNTGERLSKVEFRDHKLGVVFMTFPETVEFDNPFDADVHGVKNGNELALRFASEKITIFSEKITERTEIVGPFLLFGIKIGRRQWEYELVSSYSGDTVKLVIDLYQTLIVSEDDENIQSLGERVLDGDECMSPDDYYVTQSNSSGVCYVQSAEERPQFGTRIAGPFKSRGEAQTEKEILVQQGTCK